MVIDKQINIDVYFCDDDRTKWMMDLLGDVFGEEEFVGRRVFAQPVLGRRTRIHKSLCDDWQTRIDSRGLVNVEHEIGIFDEVHPEAQW